MSDYYILDPGLPPNKQDIDNLPNDDDDDEEDEGIDWAETPRPSKLFEDDPWFYEYE